MRTIYIETFYRGGNYGSWLQALGLAHHFSECGYNAKLVKTFSVPGFLLKHPALFMARMYNKIASRKRRNFFSPSPYAISPARQKRLDAFLADNYSEAIFTKTATWKRALEDGSVFVAGSDIIWQPARGYPARNFLDYAVSAGAPCFSYASSIGAKELPKPYYRAYRKYLGAYLGIGVREESSIELLEPIVGKPVTKVVDPTLLHPKETWDEIAAKAEISLPIGDRPFALCYFVMDDQRYWDYVARMREDTGLDVVVLPMHHSDEGQPYAIIPDGTPCEFVWLIKNACMIVTDSFHACCLSLLYEKDFYLLRRIRPDEDAKYDDFLGRYELWDRVVADPSGSFEPKPHANYSYAKEKLQQDRIDSMAFVEKMLACL